MMMNKQQNSIQRIVESFVTLTLKVSVDPMEKPIPNHVK